jgi:hypothetical protein
LTEVDATQVYRVGLRDISWLLDKEEMDLMANQVIRPFLAHGYTCKLLHNPNRVRS